MTVDPALRDRILAAFFKGPDGAVQEIAEMLASAWDEGVEARKWNAQATVENATGQVPRVQKINPFRPMRADVAMQQRRLERGVEKAWDGGGYLPTVRRVNVKSHDQATGVTDEVGTFAYTQDEQGRGTFHPLGEATPEEQSQPSSAPYDHPPCCGPTCEGLACSDCQGTGHPHPAPGDVVGRTGPDGEMVIGTYEERHHAIDAVQNSVLTLHDPQCERRDIFGAQDSCRCGDRR